MDPIFGVVFVVLVVAAGFGFDFWSQREKMEYVRQARKLRGARNILVSRAPFSGDRGNYVYNVDYEDAQGRVHHTTCKVNFWNNDVYWKDEP